LNPKHNTYKSDVFSLGCILLELASMNKLNKAFDYVNCAINFNEINSNMFIVARRYSEKLFNMLNWMLKLEEVERPDFIDIAKNLNKFEKE